MKVKPFILSIAVIWGLFSGGPVCSQEVIKFNKDVVAIVGDREIDVEELQNLLISQRKKGNVKLVLETLTEQGKVKALGILVDTKVLAIEAKKEGLDNDANVRRKIDRAVENILADVILQKEIGRLDLSQAALRRYYKANPQYFMADERVKARHIVTGTRTEAEEAFKELMEGKTFSIIASERNIDSSKSKGGLLGWVFKGLMVKPFEDALFNLEEGQVSNIVKTGYGFHIIKAEKVDSGKPKPFDAVKEKVKNKILEQHISSFKAKLKKRYGVKTNMELLQNIDN